MNGPKVGDECVENHKNERKVRTVLEDGAVEDVQEPPQDEINEVNDEEEDNTESLNNSDEDDNDESIENKVKELELEDIKEEQEVFSDKGKDGFYAKKKPYYTQLEKCLKDSLNYFTNNPNSLKCGMVRGAPTTF